MVYIIYGNEDYALNRQRVSFRKKVPALAYQEFTDVYSAIGFLTTLNFFSETLRAFLKIEKLKELTEKSVINRLQLIGEDQSKHLLIEVTGKITRADAKKVEALKEFSIIKEYNKYSGLSLERVVDNICMEQEANLTGEAKKTLLDRLDYAGNDTVTLITVENYIGQLKYLAPVIEPVDVENNVPDLRQGRRFQLAKMIAEGNVQEVLKEAEKLECERDFSAIMLLSLLHREYRIAYLQAMGVSLREQGVGWSNLPAMDKKRALNCLNLVTERIRDIKTGVYDEHTAWRLALTQLIEKGR